jgi:hypothetical protein
MSIASLLARTLVSIGLMATTPYAEADEPEPCAARDEVVRKLEERFGETLRSVGLQQDENVVEVYSSERTGSWTILMTRPDGMSCLLAAGQLWEADVRAPRKPGEDA